MLLHQFNWLPYGRIRIAILFCCLIYIISCDTKTAKLEDLKERIQLTLQEADGIYALAFLDLEDTSRTLLINEKRMFHAASTMKTPVLYELFRQAAAGRFSLEDSVLVTNEFRSIVDSSLYSLDLKEDSGDLYYNKIGEKARIFDLATHMITMSSNLATNILIGMVGAENVSLSMRDIGAQDIMILRGVEDIKAYEAGISNRTNAYDLMRLFEKMARKELVDSLSSETMLNILLQQHYNDIIPAGLQPEVKVAHKTGQITKIMHDSGVVILPDGRKYVLVLLSGEWEKEENARNTMVTLSRMIYEFYLE